MPSRVTPYGIQPREKYEITDEVLKQVREAAANGLTQSQVAGVLGITPQLFSDKKKKHPEFWEAYQIGHAEAVAKIENAAFKNATEPARDKDGNPVGPQYGNPDLQKFFLKSQAGYRENDTPTVNIAVIPVFPDHTLKPDIKQLLEGNNE